MTTGTAFGEVQRTLRSVIGDMAKMRRVAAQAFDAYVDANREARAIGSPFPPASTVRVPHFDADPGFERDVLRGFAGNLVHARKLEAGVAPEVPQAIQACSERMLRSCEQIPRPKLTTLFSVAITRARGLLHAVGDRAAAAVSGVDYLAQFADYVGRLTADAATAAAVAAPSLGADYPAVSRPARVSDWQRLFYQALYQAGLRPIPQFSVEQFDLGGSRSCRPARCR